MKKNVILLHGSAFTEKEKRAEGAPLINKRNWFPWIKEKISSKGLEILVPLMPEVWCPDYEKWKKEFEKKVAEKINQNSVLVGHSSGAGFLVRYLSENKIKVKKLILIAPTNQAPDFYEQCYHDFSDYEIDKEISERVVKIIIFLSNDEKYILDSAYDLEKRISAQIIFLPNRGHFTVRDNLRNEKFPELLKEILREEIKEEFDEWNKLKKKVEFKYKERSFNQRDVWFLHFGKNVGVEQGGKGKNFLRPVLVYQKFSKDSFLGIPLTSKKKKGIFYYSFGFKNKTSTAILSQIRLFDTKRFANSYRYGIVSRGDYKKIKKALLDFLGNKKES